MALSVLGTKAFFMHGCIEAFQTFLIIKPWIHAAFSLVTSSTGAVRIMNLNGSMSACKISSKHEILNIFTYFLKFLCSLV